MRIDNRTDWRTDDLRRIFSMVLARWNRMETGRRRVPSKTLRISIVYARTSKTGSGWAYLNSGRMRLCLPRDGLDIRKVAFLFEHELAHCAGYDHKDMADLMSWKTADTKRYDFVEGMEVRGKEAVKPPKTDVQIIRYERVIASRKRWETKLKRAQTALKKLKQKERYYEKALNADGRLAALKASRG